MNQAYRSFAPPLGLPDSAFLCQSDRDKLLVKNFPHKKSLIHNESGLSFLLPLLDFPIQLSCVNLIGINFSSKTFHTKKA